MLLNLLGRSELSAAGTVVDATALPTAKSLDLLRLVACSEPEPRRADDYVRMLWPDVEPTRGRSSLRTALSHLRRLLGPGVVVRLGDRLALGDEVSTDVARLRRAVDVAGRLAGVDDERLLRMTHALEEMCGEDLAVSDSSCEAVHALRDDLRALRCDLLVEASGAAVRLRHGREALLLARRADAVEASESTGRALMVAWASLGETHRVVETFERLRIWLGSTYGVPPSPATRQVYLGVLADDDEIAPPSIDHHAAVVRQAAGAALRLLTSAGAGAGGVVWLHGDAGSGRDRIARAALARLAERAPHLASATSTHPEVVVLDDVERRSVHERAASGGRVLLVPVRSAAGVPGPREAVVEVAPLDRQEVGSLVAAVLGRRPSAATVDRLWRTSGGLAGVVCRTVEELGDALEPAVLPRVARSQAEGMIRMSRTAPSPRATSASA